jgi:predicted HTH transcriptional regulator
LEKEFSTYLESLELPQGLSEFGGRAILSSNFFSLNSGIDSQAQKNIEPKVEEDKNNDSSNLRDREPQHQIQEPIQKTNHSVPVVQKTILDKGHLPAVVVNNLKDYGVVSAKKGNRQSVIIGLLKRKKEIMIKDVSPLIKGCSEKTIQRELSAMVQSGLLKKEGEKRWSKYSLA